MTSIRPVILCGGSGKRLWPLSRESYPKQFSNLVSDHETLLQATVRRMLEGGGREPLIMTAEAYRFIVGEQMEAMAVKDRQVIIEPASRNTAPAVCVASIRLEMEDPEAIMVITPADHHIRDEEAFQTALEMAINEAQKDQIVTFGIIPDRPETGYGYIELQRPYREIQRAEAFVTFTEKPDSDKAREMFESGRFLWNSGIFVAQVKTLIRAFEAHTPRLVVTIRQAVTNGQADLDFFRLSKEFLQAPDISIDYAIMEKEKGYVVPLDCGWNDLGAWQTVWHESAKDEKGVAINGNVTSHNCQNSLLRTEGDRIHLVGLGLKNIVAIAMRDAVLIADMDASQAVSDAVTVMRAQEVEQADEFPRSARPWGSFETLMKRARFHVKEIIVKPGQILSLQSHVHRAEHWIVVAGTARVTIDDEVKLVSENQSVFIPLGSIHRMENPGKVDLHIVEVQTGAYLEEDDITRYEDVYARR